MLFRALLSFLLSLNFGIWQTGAWAIAEDVRDGAQPAVHYPPRPHDTLNRSFYATANASSLAARPFYVIAHRVVDEKGLLAALDHGANAIEIEMTPSSDGGWLADPDDTSSSADTIFSIIAKHRRNNKIITFVWLHLIEPDLCDPTEKRKCSIDGLRDTARKNLYPVGVRTLYGFPEATGKAFTIVRDDIREGEAINLDGQANQVGPKFEAIPTVPAKKVMSYGNSDLASNFGRCDESRTYICTELRQGVQSKKYGKVFGWTSTDGQATYVEKLLSKAGIDGLMYGFVDRPYSDDPETKAAAKDITDSVKNSSKWSLATNKDAPW